MNELNTIIIETTVLGSEFDDGNKFKFACETRYNNEATYFSVVCFGKVAELARQKATEKRRIRIVGKLWQTNNEKTNNYQLVILAEHIEYKVAVC